MTLSLALILSKLLFKDQPKLGSEPDSDDEFADPSHSKYTITFYVLSDIDEKGQTKDGIVMFSSEDMQKLGEVIASSDSAVCYDINIRKEECYKRCLNTAGKPSLSTDNKTVIIGCKTSSPGADSACAIKICKLLKAYYDKSTIPVRVILEAS